MAPSLFRHQSDFCNLATLAGLIIAYLKLGIINVIEESQAGSFREPESLFFWPWD